MAPPVPPSKLTPAVQTKIVSLLRAGNFRETACAAAGVTPETMRQWFKRGAAGEEPFASFAASCNAAEAESEADAVGEIHDAGADDWKAAAWRLEHKSSSRWGTRIRHTVESELKVVLDRLERGLDAATFDRVLAIIAANDGSGETGPTGGSD